MTRLLIRLFLALSGAIALAIGLTILLMPHALFASNHVTLGSDPNLLSEIRAPGGVLVLCGAIMLGGAFRQALFRAALLAGAAVFSTYGLSRLVSVILDGLPASSLVWAMVIELVIGVVAAILVFNLGALRSSF